MSFGTTLDEQTTREMEQARLANLRIDYPTLPAEEAYREQLLQQYTQLRQLEYENTVRDECLKMYNLSKDARVCGIDEDRDIWNSYNSYINSGRTAEERERRRRQVQDSPAARTNQIASICYSGTSNRDFNVQWDSCAITATSVVSKVSAEMGYDDTNNVNGRQNIIVPKQRDDTCTRNNSGGAIMCNRIDSITGSSVRVYEPIPVHNSNQSAQRQRVTNEQRNYHINAPGNGASLNDMMKKNPPVIGIGDEVTIQNGSGPHAMVVMDIQRDANGRILNYTLQANNSPHMQTYDANAPTGFASKPFLGGCATHQFMEDRITQERNRLQSRPIEELASEVDATRQRVTQGIHDLQQTEAYDVSKRYYTSNYAVQYNRETAELTGRANNHPEATLDTPAVNPNDQQHLTDDPAVTPVDNARQDTDTSTPAVTPVDNTHQNTDEPVVTPVEQQQTPPQQQNNNEPTVRPVTEEERIQTNADFRQDRTSAHVDADNQTRAAQRENQQIADQARQQQTNNGNRSTQRVMNIGADGKITFREVEGQPQQQQQSQQSQGAPQLKKTMTIEEMANYLEAQKRQR